MKRVSREFWVSNAFLNDDKTLPFFTFSRSKTGNFPNKITISYDIEREVTIKESQLNDILESSGLTTLIQDSLKRKLFGGSENE